jgi:predicted AAA+ superfamily ATPase
MELLYEIHNRIIENTSTDFVRSLYSEINWDARLISITGSRGVGKTTMMLQYIKMNYSKNDNSVLYISLDDPYFFSESLIDTIDTFVKYGGKHLFIDEVHKYTPNNPRSDWSVEIKATYDRYPNLKIVYSGSSIILLYKGLGDLSRRVSPYKMNGLSFREYLVFNNILEYPSLSLSDILSKHIEIASDISSKTVIIRHFKDYLHHGYYAFHNEDVIRYFDKLRNVIATVLEVDIPYVMKVPFTSVEKMKKLLAVISSSVPYSINLTKVGKNIAVTDQRTLLKYLTYLEKAEIITTVSKSSKGSHILTKPSKMYLNNSNISYAIERHISEIGTARETFFYNQLSYIHDVILPKEGDFMVDKTFTFEIGGKNKDTKQLLNITNGYFAIDDIEVGNNNKIPLWLFGFMY